MTKTFTAKQMHHAPAQVFRAADRDGEAYIAHDHYKDRVFVLTAEEKKFPDGDYLGMSPEQAQTACNMQVASLGDAMAVAAPKIWPLADKEVRLRNYRAACSVESAATGKLVAPIESD